ncbi:unnamed protein product [Pedinophyceae sp. YPF-701]|nr:unnamed protein product [Pedinophyceae sp. YPF-701]
MLAAATRTPTALAAQCIRKPAPVARWLGFSGSAAVPCGPELSTALRLQTASPAATFRAAMLVRSAASSEVAAEPVEQFLDIRVGKIIEVAEHPDADSLYVEKIDLGEEDGPRTIVSGLKEFVAQEDLKDRMVIVLANLKARNMRGIKSHGMVLCASNDAHDQVEPLLPPAEAAIGERCWFGEAAEQEEPAKENRVQKKKYWETVQPDLKTSGECVATYKGETMMTSAGAVKAPSLSSASIS